MMSQTKTLDDGLLFILLLSTTTTTLLMTRQLQGKTFVMMMVSPQYTQQDTFSFLSEGGV